MLDGAGWTPLRRAAYGGSAAVVTALIEHGADPNMTDPCGNNPLDDAVEQGEAAVVAALLRGGANPNSTDPYRNPMCKAAYGGHAAILISLIIAGAEINSVDQCGSTPLHNAVREEGDHDERHTLCIAVLLKAGADRDARDNKNRRALSLALERGNNSAAVALWNKGSKSESAIHALE